MAKVGMMEYRNLGSSGLKVSALSLGAWVTYGSQVGEDVAEECMQAAYAAGVNFFDNAEAYASGAAEEVMGRVFRRAGWKRSDLVVSTKIFWVGQGPNDRGLSRKHLVEGTRAALDRLQLEYVDLLYCHRPDPETPIAETVHAMNWLIGQGMTLYWGTSEWSAEQIREAKGVAERDGIIGPTVEQPQYNMFHRHRVEVEYRRLCQDGLGLTTWSPLRSGVLTGKYDGGMQENTRMTKQGMEWLRESLLGESATGDLKKVEALKGVADQLTCTRAQLAIAWCLKNPHVSSVITGASREEQVTENMKALNVAEKLTPDVMAELERVLDNTPEPPQNYR